MRRLVRPTKTTGRRLSLTNTARSAAGGINLWSCSRARASPGAHLQGPEGALDGRRRLEAHGVVVAAVQGASLGIHKLGGSVGASPGDGWECGMKARQVGADGAREGSGQASQTLCIREASKTAMPAITCTKPGVRKAQSCWMPRRGFTQGIKHVWLS